jgi:predicted RNase H-like HicB family nuclease
MLGVAMTIPLPPIEVEREVDGRCLAYVPSMPGVMAYGKTPARARWRVVDLIHAVREIDATPKKDWIQ